MLMKTTSQHSALKYRCLLFEAFNLAGFYFLLGENMVPEQALQIQKNYETWQRIRRASPQQQLHLSLLTWAVPTLGGLNGEQRRPHASKYLHEQFWPLVSNPPSSPGRHVQASDDVSHFFLISHRPNARTFTGLTLNPQPPSTRPTF